jgi:hypothetical protein
MISPASVVKTISILKLTEDVMGKSLKARWIKALTEDVMGKSLKARWIKALRSGEYKQGFGHLRKGDCFCANGVLADIVDPKGWSKDIEENFWRWRGYGLTFTSTEIFKSKLISQLLLVEKLNDGAKFSFPEIADQLEKTL